jgi:ATP phosphoribosyltransferase
MTPLVIAIPSKGRLQASTTELFAKAGLDVVQQGAERSYRGVIAGIEGVEVAFLSAPEIAREIGAGAVHLGVTGRDQVEETVPDFGTRTELVLPLGFGHCDVVVAVPEAWIDVETMEDLDDVAAGFRPRHGRRLTVATKYINVTRRFFAGHGIADYRIVESLGATEGAPATGAADLIVDITSTGATLRDNGLKILDDGVILKSEAHLVASLTADWRREQYAGLTTMLDRLGPGRSFRPLFARLDKAASGPRT